MCIGKAVVLDYSDVIVVLITGHNVECMIVDLD